MGHDARNPDFVACEHKGADQPVHLCRLVSALCKGLQRELYCFRLVHPSVCPLICPSAVVVTLTWSLFIGYLPNSIYGLLLLNSYPCLNFGFVGRTINKIDATCLFALVDTLT